MKHERILKCVYKNELSVFDCIRNNYLSNKRPAQNPLISPTLMFASPLSSPLSTPYINTPGGASQQQKTTRAMQTRQIVRDMLITYKTKNTHQNNETI
jgi:hypothetical protein